MSVLRLLSTSGSTAAPNNDLTADFFFFFWRGTDGFFLILIFFFSDLDLSLWLSSVTLPRDYLLSTSSAQRLARNGRN